MRARSMRSNDAPEGDFAKIPEGERYRGTRGGTLTGTREVAGEERRYAKDISHYVSFARLI